MSRRDPDPAGRAARRARAIARLGLLAVLGLLVGQTPTAAQLPPDHGAPCAAAPPDSREACSGRPLDYAARPPITLQTVSQLPPARLGAPYRPIRVLYGGTPGYTIDASSRIPPGLQLTAAGFLQGTPTKAGPNVVMLVVRDSAQPANLTRGIFILNVLAPRRGGPVASRPLPGPPHPPPAPNPPASPPAVEPPAPAGQIAIWSLSQGDLGALATAPSPPPEPAPPPASPPPAPTDLHPAVQGEQSPPAADSTPVKPLFVLSQHQRTQLNVLINLEYPSLALFKSAIHARLDDPSDPGRNPSDADVEAIARQAFKPQYWSRAPRPQLKAPLLCGCVPPLPQNDARSAYGFMPFWRPTTGDQTVDLSLFDRIEVLGVQLQSDRTWLIPGAKTLTDDAWKADMSRMAATAHAHGARLDLVLHGADWRFLRGYDAATMDRLASESAESAMKLVEQTPPSGVEAFFRGFLVDWVWRSRPNRVFDGVTVMFQPPTGGDTAAFDLFFDRFVNHLITAINARGRPFMLNIVVPYDHDPAATETLFRHGAFDWGKVLGYLHLQSPKRHPPLDRDEAASYPSDSHVAIRLLVLMASPTSQNKKAMRSEIDHMENYKVPPHNVQGHARVTLTDNIIPIEAAPDGPTPILTPAALAAGGAPTYPPSVNSEFIPSTQMPVNGRAGESDNIDMDLIYYRQNFGGFGVWPLPAAAPDTGAFTQSEIRRAFFPDKIWNGIPPICSTALRLFWQLLIVLSIAGAIAYYLVDMSEKTRQRTLAGTGLAAGLAALLGFFLLNFDPALNAVKIGNAPFLVTLLILLMVGYIQYKRPKIKKP